MAKNKKKIKAPKTRIIPPGEDMPDGDEMHEDESGVLLEKDDVQLLYNALKVYKPANAKDHQLRDIWLEDFAMMLVVDYGKPME